jgi:hypothetical protein
MKYSNKLILLLVLILSINCSENFLAIELNEEDIRNDK